MPGTNYFVSRTGSDSNSGLAGSPWATPAKALATATTSGDVVEFAGGRYQISSVIAATSAQNGVTWQGASGATVIFSGGQRVTGWAVSGSFWVASFTSPFRALWINGRRSRRAWAAWGGTSPATNATGWTSGNTYMAGWSNQADIEVIVDNLVWARSRIPVSSISGSNVIAKTSAFAHLLDYHAAHSSSGVLPQRVENAYEVFSTALQRGSHYWDRANGRIYYYPRLSDNINAIDVIAGVIDGEIMTFTASTMTVQDINFEHNYWSQPGGNDGFMHIQAGMCYPITGAADFATTPPGAIGVHGASPTLLRVKARRLASSGIRVDGTSSATITGCVAQDISANGIQVGDPLNVTTAVAPSGVTISNSVSLLAGQEFLGCVPIIQFYAASTSFTNCAAHDSPYSGISSGIGWGDAGTIPNANNSVVISKPKVYNVMGPFAGDQLKDGGGIYTNNFQSGSTVDGAYIFNTKTDPGGSPIIAGLYPDNANAGVAFTNCVVQGFAIWSHANNGDATGTGHVTFDTMYVDTSSKDNNNTNNAYTTINVSAAPATNTTIVNAAGPQSPYADVSAPIFSLAVALWKLDEASGTVIDDSTYNGHAGTAQGGVTFTATGIPGALGDTAVTLNGTTGAVSLGTDTAFNLNTNFSIEVWFKFSSNPAINGVLFTTGNTGTKGVSLILNTAGKLVALINGSAVVVTSGSALATGTWHHAAWVSATTTNHKIYLNGALIATDTTHTITPPTGQVKAIGADLDASTNFFPGSMDEVTFFNIVLSTADVLARYNSGISPSPSAAAVPSTGTTVVVDFGAFTSPLLPSGSTATGFELTVNDADRAFTISRTGNTQYTLTPTTPINPGDLVQISYTPGNVTDSAGTPNAMQSFNYFYASNNSTKRMGQPYYYRMVG